ncbi:hypothetical protein V5799_012285, partial [Amblyomma americanum]
ALIDKFTNQSVDPCEDFFDYACGGWVRSNTRPNHEWHGVLNQLEEELPLRITGIMENMTIVTHDQNLTHKAGAFFQSCIAFPNETNQREGFLKVLENAGFPEWPLLPNSTEDANCSNSKELLSGLGLFPLFDVAIGTHSRKKMVEIYEDVRYKKRVRNLKDVKRVIQKAIKIIIPNASDDEMSNLTDSIVDIKNNLTALTKSYWEPSIEVKIGLLEKNFTHIPILSMLNNEFRKVDVNLTENDTVYVSPITYYEKLDAFLETTDL